jgi:probable rRNA maturation factor
LKVIKFNNNGISPGIKNKKELKLFLISVFANENIEFKSVSYVFCRDAFLLDLNKKYLHHDAYTDIITFTLSGRLTPVTAEIYISVERVQENSTSLKVDYQEELLRVMIHGILHLCGYADHSIEEKKLMRKKETFYLSKYCFT